MQDARNPVFLRRFEMTEDERTQTGKFSDEYQNELVVCYGIMLVPLLACAIVIGVAKLVALLGA